MGAGVPDQSREDIPPPKPHHRTPQKGGSGHALTTFRPVPATIGPDLPPCSDAELVLRACNGDPRAWEGIVDRHLPMVNRIARSYGLSTPDREDAVQTVWLNLNRHLPRLRSPHLLRPWLRRVTRNVCASQRDPLRRTVPVDPSDLAEYPMPEPDTEHEYLSRERRTELHRAIDELTDPADRRVARYYLDDSPDAAPITRRTTAGERRHLFRRLRRSLGVVPTPAKGVRDP